MVTGHIQRKLKQKSAYHKHASAPLPDLPAGSYVYAKPPPSSSGKACIQGKVIGYLIDSGISLILRNHIQFQLAPPQHTDDSHNSHNWTAPNLPDKLLPNSLTAMPLPSQVSQRTSAISSSTQSLVPVPTRLSASSLSTPSLSPVTPSPPTADNNYPAVSLTSSSLVSLSPTASQPPLLTSSPSLPKPQTVTHSGQAIYCPARYSDWSQDVTLNSDFFLCFRCRVPVAVNRCGPYRLLAEVTLLANGITDDIGSCPFLHVQ